MKKLKEAAICIIIFFPVIVFSQTIILGGDVSGTWTKENAPYMVEGEITIPDGLQLTIESGVLIEFQGHYRFNIRGKIIALGQMNDTITFTINDTTDFSNFEIPDGGWHSLRFKNELSTDTSVLSYCKLEYGKATMEGNDEDYYGGAIYVSDYSVLHVSNCLIKNNYAHICGGGMYDRFTEVRIEESNFISNKAGSYGGGLYTGESLVINCKFEYNYAHWDGGGITWDGYSPILINNLICNNTAGYGGGGVSGIDDFGSKMINNTICNNSASNYGGGVDFCGIFGKVEIINNIIYGNTADQGDQIFGVGGLDSVEFKHCDIEGGYEGFGGEPFQGSYIGNIDADPLFIFSGEHPYNVSPESLCIDTGMVDTTGLNLPIFDLAGNPRIYNNRIDIGAYEYFTTGVYNSNFGNLDVEIFPNPSTGKFLIKLISDKKETTTIEIFNSFGERLKSFDSNEISIPVDLSDSPNGIFFVNIKVGNENFIQKIIIQ